MRYVALMWPDACCSFVLWMWSARYAMILVRAVLHTALYAACLTAAQCDHIDVTRVDDDAWLPRPHLSC